MFNLCRVSETKRSLSPRVSHKLVICTHISSPPQYYFGYEWVAIYHTMGFTRPFLVQYNHRKPSNTGPVGQLRRCQCQ